MDDLEMTESLSSGVTAFVGGAFRGPFDQPVEVSSAAQYVETFGIPTHERPLGHAVTQFFDNGGTRAVVVRVPNRTVHPEAPIEAMDLAAPMLEADNLGIWALRRSSGFDLLCIPPLGPGVDVDAVVRLAALGVAVEHRALLLLDPPDLWRTPDDIMLEDLFPEGVDVAPVASYAAVYWPHLVAIDAANADLPGLFPPAGSVAGMRSRLDSEVGPWAAPEGAAGTLRAVGAEPVVDAATAEQLLARGVNAVRADGGVVHLAGGVTLGAGHLRSMETQRTISLIERAVLVGAAWSSDRPNDPTLWAEVEERIRTQLERFEADGMLSSGNSHVRCAGATTTDDIGTQVVVADLSITPAWPAEQISIRIPIPATDPVT